MEALQWRERNTIFAYETICINEAVVRQGSLCNRTRRNGLTVVRSLRSAGKTTIVTQVRCLMCPEPDV